MGFEGNPMRICAYEHYIQLSSLLLSQFSYELLNISIKSRLFIHPIIGADLFHHQ